MLETRAMAVGSCISVDPFPLLLTPPMQCIRLIVVRIQKINLCCQFIVLLKDETGVTLEKQRLEIKSPVCFHTEVPYGSGI